jgi:hypothetical protein
MGGYGIGWTVSTHEGDRNSYYKYLIGKSEGMRSLGRILLKWILNN